MKYGVRDQAQLLKRELRQIAPHQTLLEGKKPSALLTKEELLAIAKAPGARFSTLPELKKFRDGDPILRGAMMKAQRQRRLRWIRAGAGVEDEEI